MVHHCSWLERLLNQVKELHHRQEAERSGLADATGESSANGIPSLGGSG